MSFTNTKRYYINPEMIKRFDFIEAFNSCETKESNTGAMRLADKYKKVTVGGSDSHKMECVGSGYTVLPEAVACETDLISLIHKKAKFDVGGSLYEKTARARIGKADKLFVYSFWFYNKAGALIRRHGRNLKMKLENPTDPIDPIEMYLKKAKKPTKRGGHMK